MEHLLPYAHPVHEADDDFGLDLQDLIDSGMAWRLEGAVGRAAMAAIEEGSAVLGLVGHRDYWGNYVPSRYEVEPGSVGSVEYARDRGYEVPDPSAPAVVDQALNDHLARIAF